MKTEEDMFGELVFRARERDEEAFTQIYEKTSLMVWKKSFSILNDSELAFDAVQEVYEIVFTSLCELQSDSAFLSWMQTITKRVAYKLSEYQKELPVDIPKLEFFLKEKSENPLDVLLKREEQREVLSAIEELPERQKRFIVKKYYRNMKLRDIAMQENCPVGTVKSGLSCAKDSVKKRIVRWGANR